MLCSVSDFQIPQVLVIFPGRDFNVQQREDGVMQTRDTTHPAESAGTAHSWSQDYIGKCFSF